MHKRLALLLLLALCSPAQAYEVWLGTLTSTGTSVNNTTTAVPFSIPKGVRLAVQCDAAACVRFGSGSSLAASCTAGSANKGVKVAADALFDEPTGPDPGTGTTPDTAAAISVTGTANCEVYKVVGS